MGVFGSNTFEGVADACRLLSSLVLLIAAISKFGDLPAFRQVLGAIPPLGARTARRFVLLIPTSEAILGAWLAYSRLGTRIAAFLAMLLFLLFAALIGFLLIRNQPFSCRCFGRLSRGQASWFSVARNLLFAACSLVTALLFDDTAHRVTEGLPMVLAMLSLAIATMLSTEITAAIRRTSPYHHHRSTP